MKAAGISVPNESLGIEFEVTLKDGREKMMRAHSMAEVLYNAEQEEPVGVAMIRRVENVLIVL